MTPRLWAVSVLLFSFFLGSHIASLFAQIPATRENRTNQLSCVKTVPPGFDRSCGADRGYALVFIGSVLSADAEGKEKRLRISPEEVFFGAVTGDLTVTTSNGACLPEFLAGDQWLFYVESKEKEGALTLSYGSPSQPVADAQKPIANLRRLEKMYNSGIIDGEVELRVWSNKKNQTFNPVPNYEVIAKKWLGDAEYSTLTDSDGHFEFELPLASYVVSFRQGLSISHTQIDVRAKSCSPVRFFLRLDNSIAGRLKTAEGKPAKGALLVAVPASMEDSSLSSVTVGADDGGYFQFSGLEPGRYLIGVRIQAPVGSTERQSTIYYPGVPTRAEAVIVDLGQSEKRTIDFQLPNATEP